MKTKDVLLTIALFAGIPFALVVGGFSGLVVVKVLFGGMF